MKPVTERWKPLGDPKHPVYWTVLAGANALGILMMTALFV